MNNESFRALRTAVAAGALCAASLAVPSAAFAQSPVVPAPSGAITLDQAIEQALNRGPLASAAKSTRDAARYRDRAFGARLLPQLGLTGSLPMYSRAIVPIVQPDGSTRFIAQQQRQSALTLSATQRVALTGGDLFVSSGVSNVNIAGAQDSRLWRSTPVEVGLRQPLFRANALAWDNREQELRADLAEREYLARREEIAGITSGLYFDLYAARAALSNAEANAQINDTLYTLNKGRFEVGRIGENDLLQSELSLLRSRTALDAAKLAVERASAALRLHLGLAPDAAVVPMATASVPQMTIDTTVAMEQALRNAPAVRNRELQETQGKRRLTEARRNSAFGSTVSASFGFNQSAATFNDAFKSPLQSQQFSVGVEMPVLQWGGRRAQIEAARADNERIQTDVRTAREQQLQEARFSALELELAGRQLAIAAKADSVGAKRFEVARNRYTIGRIDFGNLAIAQTEKDQALQSFLQALRGYWDAYYRLRRVTLFDFERNVVIR